MLFDGSWNIKTCHLSSCMNERGLQCILSPVFLTAWFRWDEEKEGFYEIEKPEWANGWYGFALG